MIAQQAPLFVVRRDYHDFIRGYSAAERRSPAQIAWMLEHEAVEHGWVAGRFVGCERDLMKRFGASRDTIREAIRLVESRGSMFIERGRRGGLRLAEPDLERTAGAFAMYLRAWGCSDAQLSDVASMLDSSLDEVPDDHLIVRLYRRTLDLLVNNGSTDPHFKVRGFQIAHHLIRHYSPIPNEGVRLGSEEALCDRFSSSRPTFRQALRILDDLGMLHVQRGRGGGYVLKRPSSIGIVRQVFALLASRRQTLEDVLPMKWLLDLVKLRLAMRALARMDSRAHAQHMRSLSAVLRHPAEPYRWCLLLRELGRITRHPLVNTLLWCLVAYDVRIAPPTVPWNHIEAEMLEAEAALVQAIKLDVEQQAELKLRHVQAQISELFAGVRAE